MGLLARLQDSKNVILTNPLGYLDFIKLVRNSSKVVTDSGGVQKEAYLLGVPCIVLRKETEWAELIETGWVKLIDNETEPEKIIQAIQRFEPKSARPPVLGDGHAAERIVQIIRDTLVH
jgi:UDP-N-acetylglucosamine 2-epimerase